MSVEFAGLTAIVTGGAQGIGGAVSRTFDRAGANVVIADINPATAQEHVAEFVRPPLLVATDVAQEASVVALFEAALSRFGRVDVVVNSAGIYRMIPILETTVEDWDRVLAVNLRGTFLMGREAFRVMKPNASGRIVNIASIGGKVGNLTAGAHYCASKAGVISFTKTLAFQAAPHKITVNCVCPGPIATEMIGAWDPVKAKAYAASIPLQAFGQPQDVADAVAFLASDRAKYITGEIIDVNGGLLMD